ncbi:MAG: enoyl-CoA hydratase/isomerase family protein [Phycisphaeraceae bacterium]|nr:enoyl-CoA hydratase/isomerase family protein [Phycisphaeraceae bacterium]
MIETEWQHAVALIHLNRPEKRNALMPDMVDGLISAIESTRDRAKAVVVSGRGDAFCSGFDLALCFDAPGVLAALLRGLSRSIQTLRRHPSPVIIAAHGAAIAGGCALLGGGDLVITNAEAKLGYPVTPLGISPAVSAPFLAAAVGSGQARARLLDPKLIDGREALRIGLAHECLPSSSEVITRALAIAQDLAAKPRCGVEATKTWLNELDGSLNDARASSSLTASLQLVGSEEERQGLARFLKR